MDYKTIILDLHKKCNTLLLKYKNESNESKIKIYSSIKSILESDKPFNKLDAEISLNILMDLGYNYQQAIQVYSQIISLS